MTTDYSSQSEESWNRAKRTEKILNALFDEDDFECWTCLTLDQIKERYKLVRRLPDRHENFGCEGK